MSAEAREALRYLIHESGLCLDEGRYRDFVDLFADDGRYAMTASAPELRDEMTWLAFDRDALRAHFESIPEHVWPLGETTRIVSVGAIDQRPTEANTLATFCILRNDSDGRTECYAVGRYRDRWRPVGEAWKIAERLVELRTRLLPAPAPIPL